MHTIPTQAAPVSTSIAALLLTALPHLKANGLTAPTTSQVLDSLGVSRSRAYELKARLEALLPTLVLSGPRVVENRFFSTNEPHEDVVPGLTGPELVRRRPPYTMDLAFTLTAASDRTVELLNLVAAVAAFLGRNRWVEMARDPAAPEAGVVRWEMDPEGELQTRLDGPDDVRVFAWGFVVRGFDIDEGLTLDIGKAVIDPEVQTEPFVPGGSP